MNIYHNLTELIGNTPILELHNFSNKYAPGVKILAKLEMFNPAGSAKDRVAAMMIETAEKEGKLIPGGTIIEPTSGNTGIALAAMAAAKGYHMILVMPDTMSLERRNLAKAYGAEVVLTPGAEGMKGSLEKAEELQKNIPDSFIAGQFDNPANPAAHFHGTGPEIMQATDGDVDIYVASVGTGGTLSGTGEYLKSRKKDVYVVAVEPAESPLISEGKSGPHGIQGIGANFIPANYHKDVVDEVLPVTTKDAFKNSADLTASEGILAGISSGAVLAAAVELGKRPENKGKTIVVVLPDTGERYLSTPGFIRE